MTLNVYVLKHHKDNRFLHQEGKRSRVVHNISQATFFTRPNSLYFRTGYTKHTIVKLTLL